MPIRHGKVVLTWASLGGAAVPPVRPQPSSEQPRGQTDLHDVSQRPGTPAGVPDRRRIPAPLPPTEPRRVALPAGPAVQALSRSRVENSVLSAPMGHAGH